MIRQGEELAKAEYFTSLLYWACSLRFSPGEGLLVGLNHRICIHICRVYMVVMVSMGRITRLDTAVLT